MSALRSFHILATVACLTPAHAQPFYGDPPDEHHPWAVHDMNRPQPPVVVPAKQPGDPPSDAVVLFDGSEKSFAENWVHMDAKRRADWIVKDGALQSVRRAGYLASRQEFGDCQLHIEWAAPSDVQGDGQGRGNSGVFLMGRTEVQVLDNFENPTYPDGMAGSVYGVMPPMVNALRPPGEWQSYDIIFRRPIFRDGELVEDGRMTVFLNGVLVQDATPTEGGTGHKKRDSVKPVPAAGPLTLQDHGNPVRFRNIWYREIRQRPAEGGTDGRLSAAATRAKRAEIAAEIRDDAATRDPGLPQTRRLLESLVYEVHPETLELVTAKTTAYVEALQLLSPEEREAKKREIQQLYDPLKYLIDSHKILEPWPAYSQLKAIFEAQGWRL